VACLPRLRRATRFPYTTLFRSARTLADNGIDTMFGLVGEGNLFIANSLVSDHGGAYVAAANEAGAVMMALGYASVSDRIGVATRSEEHTSELQSRENLVCRLLL